MQPDILLSATQVLGQGCWNDNGTIKIWNGNEEESQQALTAEQLADVQAHYDAAVADHNAKQYARERKEAYPNIGDQLDMIFRAGLGGDEFQAAIQAVKDAHPKPE